MITRISYLDTQTLHSKIVPWNSTHLCLTTAFSNIMDDFSNNLMELTWDRHAVLALATLRWTMLSTEPLTTKNVRLKWVRHYIDDMVLVVHKEDIHKTLNLFNGIHGRIQFTIKQENNLTLTFLDFRMIMLIMLSLISIVNPPLPVDY